MPSHENDLARLRKTRGFQSRQDFADALGVDRVTVFRWETGERKMSAEMCRRVAKLLKVPMETVVRTMELHRHG